MNKEVFFPDSSGSTWVAWVILTAMASSTLNSSSKDVINRCSEIISLVGTEMTLKVL